MGSEVKICDIQCCFAFVRADSRGIVGAFISWQSPSDQPLMWKTAASAQPTVGE